MKYPNLEKLVDIIAVLRSENGCPWDREQTHKTLRPNMLEEAYEAVDAIDDGDIPNLREELGDVLLQVVLHAQIAKDNNEFDIEDVAKELSDKLIHRHPHVFGDAHVDSANDLTNATLSHASLTACEPVFSISIPLSSIVTTDGRSSSR